VFLMTKPFNGQIKKMRTGTFFPILNSL